MAIVLYTCPYVPAEWIAAHGFRPQRVMPYRTTEHVHLDVTTGICPYVRAFMSAVQPADEAAVVVMTTTCDQMRRASELLALRSPISVFLMHVPATWESANAPRMYRDELKRLGRFLVRLGGRAPSDNDLSKQMDRFDANRAALRAAAGELPPRRYSESIAEFHRTGEWSVPAERNGRDPSSVRLALVGGPMLREDLAVFEWVEAAGGSVVLDGTETGERGMPAPFDRRRLREDPLVELVEAYFGGIVDAFRRPNDPLHEWIRRECADRRVRGILYRRYVWCDTWLAELARLRERTSLPVLDVEVGNHTADADTRTLSRIQAFLETLR
jgi:benzoyl-CoA reductase/2-hydroxyglutaryl-CoA dehydratase subunit BcrC/BadD/HgdB